MVKIGDYYLNEMIGRGGQGTVYKAIDSKTNQLVSIKVLLITEENPQNEEVDTLRKLYEDKTTSEYVMKYYGDFNDYINGKPALFIVLEYIVGMDLGSFIAQNTHNLKNPIFLWPIMHQLILGLQFIHTKGVSHNDVNPDNIMITKDNEVKYIDFGLSCINKCPQESKECTNLCTYKGDSTESTFIMQKAEMRHLYSLLQQLTLQEEDSDEVKYDYDDGRTVSFINEMFGMIVRGRGINKSIRPHGATMDDVLELFKAQILWDNEEAKISPKISRNAAIEYIIFTVMNTKSLNEKSMIKMYKEKGITIKNDFYNNINHLGDLYDQIDKIYNDKNKVTQFIKVAKIKLLTNETQEFKGFKQAEIFKEFYDLYNQLVNNLS